MEIFQLQPAKPHRPVKKINLKIIIAGVALLLALASIVGWWFWEIPLTSPLSELSQFQFLREPAANSATASAKIVYGFLPYWNLDNFSLQPELTHLAYFGLTVDGAGNIVTQTDEGTEPGYAKLNSDELTAVNAQLTHHDQQFALVLAQFNSDTITQLVSNQTAWPNLLTSLDSILLAYPVADLNLDFEYLGEITPTLRQNFAELVKTIRQHLDQQYANITLSIDLYATAAKDDQIWDIQALEPWVDYYVVMAYDFHRRSSPQSGPVAPLFGGRQLWDTDINQNLKKFLKKVPNEKILLGLPFYGYEWQTDSRQPQANTYPDSGATASYQRVQNILAQSSQLQVQTGWDDQALAPYLSYIEDGKIYFIYYEDATSLSYKLEYVNELDLAGIAIWALGYEGSGREMWNEVEKRL